VISGKRTAVVQTTAQGGLILETVEEREEREERDAVEAEQAEAEGAEGVVEMRRFLGRE
jgi:hypothetical protein